MEKLDFLNLDDDKAIFILNKYKESKSLSYEELAIRVDCHRESLSKFMHGKGAGTKIRRLVYKWCESTFYSDSMILTYMIKHAYKSNISEGAPDDAEIVMLTKISSMIARRLKEIAQKPNPKYRLNALEHFL